MKKLFERLGLRPGSVPETGDVTKGSLDYDKAFFLDAEDLAEQGIGEAYDELKPHLVSFVEDVAEILEQFDPDTGEYSVRSQDAEYQVSAPNIPDGEGSSWGRAAFALFSMVNAQLQDTDVRLYALNGGNDLQGIFLSASEYEEAMAESPDARDRPYLPTPEHPWYGQAH